VPPLLYLDTELTGNDLDLRVTLPFTSESLGGCCPFASRLVRLVESETALPYWDIGISGNLRNSPGYGGPEGDFFSTEGLEPPILSEEVGDHGVFWNPTLGQGFVWANLDTTGQFALQLDDCATQFHSDKTRVALIK